MSFRLRRWLLPDKDRVDYTFLLLAGEGWFTAKNPSWLSPFLLDARTFAD
jgi:hypothetical protein